MSDDLRVLFVDDEAELVSAVVARLDLRGIDACGAMGGQEALRLAERRAFDVVVLDVKMRGMDGFEVLRRLRRFAPRLPVVLVSGHGSVDAMDEGLRLGAVEYLHKPVDIEELVDAIRVARRRGAGREPHHQENEDA